MKKTHRWFFAIALIMVSGAVVILFRSRTVPSAAGSGPPVPIKNSEPSANATAVRQAEAEASPFGTHLRIDDAFRRRLQKAIASGDALEWAPVLSDLLNPFLNRDDAIRTLVELLEQPDWNLRVRAAQLLLQLGSNLGVATLQAALAEGARGGQISVLAVAAAATKLHLFRQPIDSQALFAAYQRFKSPELLMIAMVQQLPQLQELVQQKRASRELGYDTELMAAYLGMSDPQSLQHYRQLLNANPKGQLLAHWALYQATQQVDDLAYVLASVRQATGLVEAGERAAPIKIKEFALDILQITFDPKVTAVLREIADHAATQASGNVHDFSRAFTALYYLHRDYDFVDRRVMDYFNGDYRGSGIDRGLMMQVAAARGTPELEAAAKRFSPEAYEQEFVRMRAWPVERWVDLRHVPVSVLKAIPSRQ